MKHYLFFNAQSLLSKIDELSIPISETNPDIIGIVETWLDGNHPVGSFELDNYAVEYKLRDTNPNRGGVLVYIKKDIRYEVLYPTEHDIHCKCENLWIRIFGNN